MASHTPWLDRTLSFPRVVQRKDVFSLWEGGGAALLGLGVLLMLAGLSLLWLGVGFLTGPAGWMAKTFAVFFGAPFVGFLLWVGLAQAVRRRGFILDLHTRELTVGWGIVHVFHKRTYPLDESQELCVHPQKDAFGRWTYVVRLLGPRANGLVSVRYRREHAVSLAQIISEVSGLPARESPHY